MPNKPEVCASVHVPDFSHPNVLKCSSSVQLGYEAHKQLWPNWQTLPLHGSDAAVHVAIRVVIVGVFGYDLRNAHTAGTGASVCPSKQQQKRIGAFTPLSDPLRCSSAGSGQSYDSLPFVL